MTRGTGTNIVIPSKGESRVPGYLKLLLTRPRMAHQPAIYILSNKFNGTLYVGVTSNLIQRVWQHKTKVVEGFTAKYNLEMLVYYELHCDINAAILREKQLKKWRRQWKLNLINKSNPNWIDLWGSIID